MEVDPIVSGIHSHMRGSEYTPKTPSNLYYYLRGFTCLDSSFYSSKMPIHHYV